MPLTKVSFSLIDGIPLNVVDYGAVGDGSTDCTAAIQAAFDAVQSAGGVYFPPGNYKITAQITLTTNNVAVFGEGSTQTIITYAGANTTNDIFLMGNGTNEFKNLTLKGLRVTSTVTMTGGFAFHFRRIVRSYLNDIVLEGQDGNSPSKVYGGLWFDGCDDVQLTQFRMTPLNEGIRINGLAGAGQPKAGLFINDGKITGGTIGVHVGGAFGGLYINMTDIIAMSTAGVKIDTSIVAEANREVFLGQTCVIDSISAGYGIHITDALGGGQTLQMTGTWVASASSHGVFFDNCTTYIATLTGCVLFNNGGDGLQLNNTNPKVLIAGSTIRNNGGYGINGGVNNNGVRIADCVFLNNASGDFTDWPTLTASISQQGQFVKELIIGETSATSKGSNFTIATGLDINLANMSSVNAAYSKDMLVVYAGGRGSSAAYTYINCANTAGGSFKVDGTGQIYADFGTIVTPADYAEMFEWADGNLSAEDRIGMTVALVGNKIKIAEFGDTPIGVVSAEPVIVGDAAPFRWTGAFVRDDWGRTQFETVQVIEWKEKDPGEFHTEKDVMGRQVIVVDRPGGEKTHSYIVGQVPNGIVPPTNAVIKTVDQAKTNPSWDKDQIYVPRKDRKEWSAVGMLGKLRIKKGAVVSPSWIKMRDISENIEEWLVK